MHNKVNFYLAQLNRGGAVSPDLLDSLPEDDKEIFLSTLVKYIHRRGYYIHAEYNLLQRQSMFANLRHLSPHGIWRGKICLEQNFTAQGLTWFYFPHVIDIPAGKGKKILGEVLRDPSLLRQSLARSLMMHAKHETMVSWRSLEHQLPTMNGTQMASNFRPSAAKAIYSKFAPHGTVWDMSCGHGGRLLGALSAPIAKYIGTDPSTPTMAGLLRMVSDLGTLSPTQIELHQCGSEVFVPSEPVDFCFTSPPYFNTERYTEEPTQSWKKFPTLEKWLDGFLRKTVRNCGRCLKPSGILALNVSEYLEEAVEKICRKEGFVKVEKLYLLLSKMPGSAAKRSKVASNRTKMFGRVTEPILIFDRG